MHPGIREQQRDELSINKDSTAKVTLLTFLKPNPGIDLDYEVGELGVETRARLRCHIGLSATWIPRKMKSSWPPRCFWIQYWPLSAKRGRGRGRLRAG